MTHFFRFCPSVRRRRRWRRRCQNWFSSEPQRLSELRHRGPWVLPFGTSVQKQFSFGAEWMSLSNFAPGLLCCYYCCITSLKEFGEKVRQGLPRTSVCVSVYKQVVAREAEDFFVGVFLAENPVFVCSELRSWFGLLDLRKVGWIDCSIFEALMWGIPVSKVLQNYKVKETRVLGDGWLLEEEILGSDLTRQLCVGGKVS